MSYSQRCRDINPEWLALKPCLLAIPGWVPHFRSKQEASAACSWPTPQSTGLSYGSLSPSPTDSEETRSGRELTILSHTS